MLQLKDVSKRFGDVVALHPTDLTIEGGQTTALIGPSGCGKSTILRLIIGYVELPMDLVFLPVFVNIWTVTRR